MTTSLTSVREAVDAVREHFAGHSVEVFPDGAGGAHVIVHDVKIGSRYTPESTWLGFQLNAAYPQSDVYPHYIGRVGRCDGQPHGEGIQFVDWQGRPALQLSRRSNRWNPSLDNAILKAEKVITWFATR
jgi:hypothetical protein